MPIIAITGNPDWLSTIRAQLTARDYEVAVYADRDGFVPRLTDEQTALIIVDGLHDDWEGWVTAPKTNNATRRISLVFVAADSARRAAALLAGADLVLTPAELPERLTEIIRDYARVLDTATLEQLEHECREPLPELARQGFAKFNAGEYYPQHDLFEAQWVQTSGPVRDLYRAILQVGVAYYQITRGNHRGALKMLLRSVQWLSILPDVCQGMDVRQLRIDSARVRAELERIHPDDIATFDRTLLKPLRWADDAD